MKIAPFSQHAGSMTRRQRVFLIELTMASLMASIFRELEDQQAVSLLDRVDNRLEVEELDGAQYSGQRIEEEHKALQQGSTELPASGVRASVPPDSAGALPAGALPAGALPAGALPAGMLPAGAEGSPQVAPERSSQQEQKREG